MRKDDLGADNLGRIVKEAFGINYRMRFFPFKSEVGYQIIVFLRHEEYCLVGQFGEDSPKNDGSEIVVLPTYKSRAEKYAELYESLTGKEVNIVLSDTLNWDGPLESRAKVSEDKQKSSEGRQKYINPFEVEFEE